VSRAGVHSPERDPRHERMTDFPLGTDRGIAIEQTAAGRGTL